MTASSMTALLDAYLDDWDLSEPVLLSESAASQVYRVTRAGELLVLKLLADPGSETRSAAAALRWFGGRGAVHLYHAADHAHLVEYAPGDDLVSLARSGTIGDERATTIIASVLRVLHEREPAPNDRDDRPETYPEALIGLESWFAELFDVASDADEFSRHVPVALVGRAAGVARALLDEPWEIRVLHGDVHHGNIRHHPQRGWVAIDPKGLVGDRAYDCANALCNPFSAGIAQDPLVLSEYRLAANAAILASELGIELSRILAFAFVHSCLSGIWFLEDGAAADAERAFGVATTAERLLQRA